MAQVSSDLQHMIDEVIESMMLFLAAANDVYSNGPEAINEKCGHSSLEHLSMALSACTQTLKEQSTKLESICPL